MSAKSARRLLERLFCDPTFLDQLSTQPLTPPFFAEQSGAAGFSCSLEEVQAAAGEDPAVPAELWFGALLSAARGAPAS